MHQVSCSSRLFRLVVVLVRLPFKQFEYKLKRVIKICRFETEMWPFLCRLDPNVGPISNPEVLQILVERGAHHSIEDKRLAEEQRV